MIQLLIAILLAVALDRFVPDRHAFRPFAWYRDWAESIEQRFNGGSRLHGVAAVLLALVPVIAALLLVRYVLAQIGSPLRFAFDVVVLYACIDVHRQAERARAVADALEGGDVREADAGLKALGGKGGLELGEAGIAHTAVETVLKQGNSLIVAPLFWFILLGPAGAVLLRLASMLDGLWGHRDERFAAFGWAAARLDDVLQWVPARITALSYAIMGSFEEALQCWRQRVGAWSDINSGPLLASGFGAMHMQTCEAAVSEASDYEETVAGFSVTPDASHVRGVVALVWRVLLFWLAVGALMTIAHLFGLFAG